MENSLSPDTALVHAGRPPRIPGGPINVSPVLTSMYYAGGEIAYARAGNPTWDAFEEALGTLEGGRALAFASGMAAIAAVIDLVPVGARVVSPRDGYNGTKLLLRKMHEAGRVESVPVDITDTESTVAVCEGASLLIIESPSNPLLGIADISALCARGRAAGAIIAVDNTFATPLLQNPLALGAHIVVHSATKFLSGHADLILGASITNDDSLFERMRASRLLGGGIPGPVETFLALRGMRTLGVRLERAQRNAGVIAERLASHPVVAGVRYPGLVSDPGHTRARDQMRGFGAMVAFEVAGGPEAAEAVCGRIRLILHSTSLGGVETTLERRARHQGEETTPPSLIRMSVGIEDVDDLWRDLDAALTP